jgi:hypothetical protein
MFRKGVDSTSGARRRGELSVSGVQSSAPHAPPYDVAVVAWINSERRSHDAAPESVRPPPKGEGTAWPSRSSELNHRLAKSKTHTKMLISNEAERLVYEPGLAGQKSEVMMSPASRSAWRGFSYAITSDFCLVLLPHRVRPLPREYPPLAPLGSPRGPPPRLWITAGYTNFSGFG